MTRTTKLTGWALATAMLIVPPLVAQGPGYPELDSEDELRLAMSAGPPKVSAGADVWVMAERGFEKAIAGTNGFSCLVVRAASGKSQLAPHCLNPAATETVLPAFLREGELQAMGMSGPEIDAELRRQWGSEELPMPAGPAWAYMLSQGQRLGPSAGAFRPHFMLYVPYATNEQIGGDPSRMEFPFVGPYENHPLSTVVVLMEEFVDPESIVLPGGR